jgi:hypothetical protein
MRCSSLLLRPEPRCEIVERDAQSRGNLGERGEAAGFAPRFDLGQIARRDPGGGGERLAAEAAMGAPNADRVLTCAEASDQLDRQIVGVRLLFAEGSLARLGRSNCGVVFSILEALDQRLVLGAAERDGLALLAHRYASVCDRLEDDRIRGAVDAANSAPITLAQEDRRAARAAAWPPNAPQMVPRRTPLPCRATPGAPALASRREPSTRPV